VNGELFKMMTGVNIVHVPYRGGAPALSDLLGGQVQAFLGFAAASIEHVKAGKLRALAVTTAIRTQALPDVTTVSEFVPGYEASDWLGIGVPKKTPTGIIEKLNQEINTAVDDPKLKTRFGELVAEPMSMTPAEFGKLILDETEKWAKVVKFAGLKAD
jgi:tripartite-type tricarboxylate transporter receptor subunit TctC